MVSTKKCPKCGYSAAGTFVDCPNCGVIISKFLERQKELNENEENQSSEIKTSTETMDNTLARILHQLDNWQMFRITIFAYFIGTFLYAIVFFLSYTVPPLKKVIAEYKKNCTFRSVLVMDIISVSIFTFLFSLICNTLPVNSRISNWGLIGLYLVWLLLGFFALFVLFDIKSNKSENIT